MAIYQEKAKTRIKNGLRRMTTIVERAKKEEYKEADTRTMVSEMLSDYLGWDKYKNVTAEQMIGSRFADYVVKTNKEEVFVVEVKQVNLTLKDNHLNQARQYAVDEGIDWIILTNGDDWNVYRTTLKGKIPVTSLVFKVTISDKATKPADKAELLYLLSEEAHRKNEIEEYYQRKVALSGENLADHILSVDVLNRIRLSIKNSTGQRFTCAEIAEALTTRLFRDEKITENHERLLRKLQRENK